jgi:amidophosphoribosyltransferase
MGLISSIFDEEVLSKLTGYIAVGHTRYSTTGSSVVLNAQPLLEHASFGDVSLAHNGNLTNTEALRANLDPATKLAATSDSEVLAKAIVQAPGADLVARIRSIMSVAEGAYSVVMSTEKGLYAFRDPWGVRPLCYGRFPGGGYMFASESCALATVGAQYIRELDPGEIISLDNEGLHVDKMLAPKPQALCMFEYIYFARPDSVLSGTSTWHASKWAANSRASIRWRPTS